MTIKIKNFIIISLILIFINNIQLFSQCGCVGSPPIASSLPFGGTANSGFLTPQENRIALIYRYSYGDKYLLEDKSSANNLLTEFFSHFISLNYSKGISEKFNIDTELNGFILKKEKSLQPNFNQNQSGLSRVAVLGKYNVLQESTDDIEFNVSLGAGIPLKSAKDDSANYVQKHIQTSTGAFSMIGGFFAHKYVNGVNLFLANRSEYNFKNNLGYLYGASFYTSLIGSKKLTNEINGVLEIRNEYRLQNHFKSELDSETGGNIFIISPQIDYNFGDWNLSINFDYPFYKYYNGKQPAISYVFGINWFLKF